MFIREYTDYHGSIALNLEDVSYFAPEEDGTVIYFKGKIDPIKVKDSYGDVLRDARACQNRRLTVRGDGGSFDVHSK